MTAATTLQTFLFTDLVGSTELKRALGDAAGSAAIAQHDALFRQCLAEFGGVEQNNPGDGFFATFGVPSAAVRCALQFQDRLRGLDLPRKLEARVGIHIGESSLVPGATGQPEKLLGLAVDIAGRVMNLSGAGQILMTRLVFDSARQHVAGDFAWRAHGPYLLKGIDEPVEIFETGVDGVAPLQAPADTEKSRRALRPGDEETLGWRPAAGLEVPGRADWKLEHSLGQGGFGEIWLARNDRTGEQRAFKFCFDAERLQSLKRELTLFRLIKQTLGNRPDITRLYEVQFDSAPYFLELEYTSGGTVAQWLQDTTPLATRLEIVAQIADALAAAHSVGVIHKDVKPSNVLIDTTHADRPQARLTDFGIGRLLDRGALADAGVTLDGFDGEPTLAPDLGSQSGTRIYMAPELMAGKPASIASDIYSTGVMLYQLVIGQLDRPLAHGWEADIEDGLLREDITACVAGTPEARLRSADLLATRLRSLGERRSERDRAREQARRDARRRRVFRMSLTATIVLLLVTATALVGYFRADRERRRAEGAEARARQRFAEVRGLANAVLFEFDQQLSDLPGSLPARRLLVERAVHYLDNLPTEEGDAALALERIRGYRRVAGIQGLPGQPNLGDGKGALATLEKAYGVIAPLHERSPGDPAIEFALAGVVHERGALLTVLDRDEKHCADLDLAEQIMTSLCERYPDERKYRGRLAQVVGSKAVWLHLSSEDPTDCFPHFERAIELFRSLGDLNRKERYALALLYSNYGTGLSMITIQNPDLDKALAQYKQERAILEKLIADAPTALYLEQALARSHMGSGRICYFQRRLEDALAWYDRASEPLVRLRTLHPSDVRTRRFFATVCRRRAQVRNRQKQPAAALEEYLRAVEALTDLPQGVVLTAPVLRERAILHEQVGHAQLALDDTDLAYAAFERALADCETAFSPASTDRYRLFFFPMACRRVAMTLEKTGEMDRAGQLFLRMESALAELERQQPDSPDVAEYTLRGRWNLAVHFRERGSDADRAAAQRRDSLRAAARTCNQMLATYDAFPKIAAQPGDDRKEVEELLQECEAALKELGR
ncbi:MAG: protein kinase domain-containing protein [Planctomycetota bacterium]